MCINTPMFPTDLTIGNVHNLEMPYIIPIFDKISLFYPYISANMSILGYDNTHNKQFSKSISFNLDDVFPYVGVRW